MNGGYIEMGVKMNARSSIGIFDSGLGGLAVLREVHRLLPHEEVLFFGDTLRQPYGPRTVEEVRQFAIEISGYLIQRGVKMILIGCNTASIAGGDAAQRCFPDTPIIGMIAPGVRAALLASHSKRIGIWGTEITVASKAYDQLIVNTDHEAEVVGVACPTLLRLAEKGKIDDRPYLRELAMKYFQKVADFKADTLVLGCTDFTCVRDIIDEVVGKQVTVVDPAEEVVREASRILATQKGLHPYTGRPATSQFFITGEDHDNFSTFGAKFLGVPNIDVTRVPLTDIEKLANCAS